MPDKVVKDECACGGLRLSVEHGLHWYLASLHVVCLTYENSSQALAERLLQAAATYPYVWVQESGLLWLSKQDPDGLVWQLEEVAEVINDKLDDYDHLDGQPETYILEKSLVNNLRLRLTLTLSRL